MNDYIFNKLMDTLEENGVYFLDFLEYLKNKIQEEETEQEKAERLTREALAKLEQADEIILNLVNAEKLAKCEQNKIYNIILQLQNILEG